MQEITVRQKLGILLQNKVLQKLKLKKRFSKRLSPKLMFLNENKQKKYPLNFDKEKSTLEV